MNLPKYGRLSCRRCFDSCSSNESFPHPLWKLRNDPGAWGGSKPEILVLGFSKGCTQMNIYENGKFEDVAFGGPTRDRLDELLKRIELLGKKDHITNEICNPNSHFGFGSLVRCSLTREGHDGKHISSGKLVVKSFKEIPKVLINCTDQYLSDLPNVTRIILMLGVTEQYIASCYNKLRKLYPSLTSFNSVSYGDHERIFIHITHPSPANGHFEKWRKGNSKFDDACIAVSAYKAKISTSTISLAKITNSQDVTKKTDKLEVVKEKNANGVFPETSIIAELNKANVNNNHISFTKYKSFFPAETIGGSNKQSRAKQSISLECVGSGVVETDIDTPKWMFRDRTVIRIFFKNNDAKIGDLVKITRVSKYGFRAKFVK